MAVVALVVFTITDFVAPGFLPDDGGVQDGSAEGDDFCWQDFQEA